MDFEKIDFALPGDATYGDDPENEFFNPAGKFKATPLRQDLIDDLTTEKNVRQIFNLRRGYRDPRKESTNNVELPQYMVTLYVILPSFLPACSTKDMQRWGKGSFKTGEFSVAPDNHTVVQDEIGDFGLRITADEKQRYYGVRLYSWAASEAGDQK